VLGDFAFLPALNGAITLCGALFQETYAGRLPLMPLSKTTIRATEGLPDLRPELFPLHSPLLGESWLVSFPPLINMLKFRG